jgi:uncharacterized membrane protein
MKHRLRVALGLAVLLAAISTGAQRAQAGLRFCNNFPIRLEVAISYPDGPRGWIAQGWWIIDGGQCQEVIVGSLKSRYYYYFAHGSDGGPRFSGETPYCIQTRKFLFYEAQFGRRTEADCAHVGLRVENFKALDTGDSKNHTVRLGGG